MEINKAKFERVVKEATEKASNNPRWIAAIDKAVAGLLSGQIIVTELFDGALVTTENGSYLSNGSCECKAFQYGHKECRYRAAARLWERYEAEAAPVAVPPASERESLIAEIKSAWSSKFPHDNLSDNLMARFKKNQLEMISTDFLHAIAAIAVKEITNERERNSDHIERDADNRQAAAMPLQHSGDFARLPYHSRG